MPTIESNTLAGLNVLLAATTLAQVGATQYVPPEGGAGSTQKYIASLAGQAIDVITDVTLTAAQVKALNATPITLVAAPAAGTANVLLDVQFFLDYNSAAYAGIAAGEDLAVRYTNGSGDILATIEATGFLDATADAFRFQTVVATSITPAAAAAIVLHMIAGEIITGDSPLKVRIRTRNITLAF